MIQKEIIFFFFFTQSLLRTEMHGRENSAKLFSHKKIVSPEPMRTYSEVPICVYKESPAMILKKLLWSTLWAIQDRKENFWWSCQCSAGWRTVKIMCGIIPISRLLSVQAGLHFCPHFMWSWRSSFMAEILGALTEHGLRTIT